MKLNLLSALLFLTVIPPAAADPVVDSFYARCITENAYQLPPGELESACGCMAPLLVSFLKPEARAEIDAAITSNRQISFSGSPYLGHPADLSRRAIKECPSVGAAMYQQKCAGGNEQAAECQEMKALIEGQ